MSDDVKITRRTSLYRGHFRLDRYRFRHRLYGGGSSQSQSREIYDRGPAVALLPYDPDRDRVVLIEQFRLPAHLAGMAGWQIETVAGLVDRAGESEASVARREAKEEAGIEIAGVPVPMHRVLTSPGGSTEIVAIYCARIDSGKAGGVHGLAGEGEDIKVIVLPFREAMRMVRSGAIANATTVIALYWLDANRDRLKRRWKKKR